MSLGKKAARERRAYNDTKTEPFPGKKWPGVVKRASRETNGR